MIRIFTASLATETNSFSPIPTDRRSFASRYYPPGTHPATATQCTAPLVVARRRAPLDRFELIEGSCFFAQPSAAVSRAGYESMRDEILDQLRAALPVDGVLLGLHGAMIADGYDDCEGDLLERARAIVGTDLPIGIHLDPHCHLTVKRVRLADLIVLYKEYPHIDFNERAEELLTLLLQTIRGEISPVMSVYDCGMVELIPTSNQPGRALVERMKAAEKLDHVLSVSLSHGFAPGDVPECGMRTLVITDDAKYQGDAIAMGLAEHVRAERGTWGPRYLSVDAAIDIAYANDDGPVVVADSSDNAGGGAPSDSTHIIRRLLERGCQSACVGPLWDPIAVQFCHAAGVGAELDLRFGGKVATSSGAPIDARVTVIGSKTDGIQTFGPGGVKFGDAAGIRVGGVEVSLISNRTQALGLEIFTDVGIDPRSKRFIGVKSSQHFHAAYAPLASRVVYCDAGGAVSFDLRKLPHRKITRPLWPLDELPPGRFII